MFEEHCRQVEAALKRAEEKAGLQVISERFFEKFFELYPQTLQYFTDTDIPSFAPRKYKVITTFLVDTVKHPDFADGELTDEVRRHLVYGLVDKEYYFNLVDTMEVVVKEVLDDEWTAELENYWQDVAQGMKSIVGEASTHVFK